MKTAEIHNPETLRAIAKEAAWMSARVTDTTTAKAYLQFAESAGVLMIQINAPQGTDNVPPRQLESLLMCQLERDSLKALAQEAVDFVNLTRRYMVVPSGEPAKQIYEQMDAEWKESGRLESLITHAKQLGIEPKI